MAAVLGTLLLCGTGCGDPADQETSTVDVAATPSAPAEDALGLTLTPMGRVGAVPAQLAVHADAELFPVTMVSAPALDGTRLVLDPDLKGALTISDARTLTFAPATGFRPDTTYTAHVSSVATLAQTWSAPTPDAWSTTFQTAPMGLLRVSAQGRDRSRREATVDLVFTAPVAPEQVASRLTVQTGGHAMQPVSVTAGPSADTVRLALRGDALASEQVDLSVAVAAGVPWAYDGDVTAPAGQGQVTLSDGPPVEILAVMVKEGVSGHYIEVVCRDHAVDGTRWYWDRDTYDSWDVSPRCMISEDTLARSVHLASGSSSASSETLSIAQAPGGFRIFGPLERGTASLRIDAGARTLDGGVLPLAYDATLQVPPRKPTLRFRSQGRYLPRDAWHSLPVEHLNVSQATLRIRHIPPQNLAFWIAGDEASDQRTSDLVLKQKITLVGQPDQSETTWLDVGGLLPDVKRGVYQLSLDGQGEGEQGAHAASRLLLTDMHIVAKAAAPVPDDPAASDVWVWVVGVQDNLPLSGVALELLQPSGRVAATCRTDPSGGCRLRVAPGGVDDAAPIAVVARKGDDLTYLAFDEVQDQPEDDVSGAPFAARNPYQAAVWTDRGVYRPGDVAHIAALLRDVDYIAPDASLPVIVKVFDPRSREI
ncbi:MAG: hypothetical protein GXP62_09220, partial [Oligoflexia bacterium]|nr:hypothetical protein [Oligoflexia bacterium]